MNTLLPNSIQKKLHEWGSFREAAEVAAACPLKECREISGVHGVLHSYFIREFFEANKKKWLSSLQYNVAGYSSQALACDSARGFSSCASKLVVVVPGDREAALLRTDLATVFSEAEVSVIPNWGTLAYRPAAICSRVFGERAGALAKLALRSGDVAKAFRMQPEIFIVPQKVFEGHVPPAAYIRSLLVEFQRGQRIDTMSIAERLSSLGYTRVPRVGMPGEFSLRGEVLDIFLPGEELAARVLFDFDSIEEIKSFDPETQATVAKLERLLVYPMKEVIWTQELTDRLEAILEEASGGELEHTEETEMHDSARGADAGEFAGGTGYGPRLPFTAAALEARDALLRSLRDSGAAEGEELFYPVLWDSENSILDYIDGNGMVFFYD